MWVRVDIIRESSVTGVDMGGGPSVFTLQAIGMGTLDKGEVRGCILSSMGIDHAPSQDL